MKAALTPQEYRVLVLLGHGLDVREVGGRLGLAPSTVRVHVNAAYRKLRVKNRAQAFYVLGWLTPPKEDE